MSKSLFTSREIQIFIAIYLDVNLIDDMKISIQLRKMGIAVIQIDVLAYPR